MLSNYIVCYDISNERRLSRVFRTMKGIGLHFQYSVFYCRLTWNALKEVKERLNKIIDKERDDIRIYPLPAKMNMIVMGCGDRLPEGVEIFT